MPLKVLRTTLELPLQGPQDRVPFGYWADSAHRGEAVLQLLKALKKEPKDLTVRDIVKAGLGGIVYYYKGTKVILAHLLKDAGIVVESTQEDEWGLRPFRSSDRWKISREKARSVVLLLAKKLGKEPPELTQLDLKGASLQTMVRHFHPDGSSDMTGFLTALGFEVSPFRYGRCFGWRDPKYRRAALRHFVNIVTGPGRKKVSQIRYEDFRSHGLGGLFGLYCQPRIERTLGLEGYILTLNSAVARALLDAGVIERGSADERTLERHAVRLQYTMEDPSVVRKTIRTAVKATGKHPQALRYKDLAQNGARTPLDKIFKGDYLAALRFAGFDVDEDHLIGRKRRKFWASKDNRVKAMRKLVEDKGGPCNVTSKDLAEAKLQGLQTYHPRLCDLLKEAGYPMGLDQRMKFLPRGFWDDPTLRRKAVRQLVDKKGGPDNVLFKDFVAARLWSLTDRYPTFYAMVRDAGYDIEPWQMAGLVPRGYWLEERNRKKALLWLLSRTRSRSQELTLDDFRNNRLYGLYLAYHNYPDILGKPHVGRLSSKAPFIKRILVREGLLKGDGLYGGTVLRGDRTRKAKGYERHWVAHKERPVRMKARPKAVRGPRKGPTAWKTDRSKGKARIRNF